MYVSDPTDLMRAPVHEQGEEDIEPRDYHDFFHDDRPALGQKFTGRPDNLHTEVCRLNPDGTHITMAEHCPHFSTEDEMGRPVTPGWTIQQNR